MNEFPLLEKAMRLAVCAHEGQTRKTDGAPYIVHPFGVALLLAKHGFSDIVLAAALTHDVLEDTAVSPEQLKEELGHAVFAIVQTLTENKTLPWEDRKKKYIEAVRAGAQEAKIISAADKIHNAQTLLADHAKQGPALWKKFSRGKEQKMWFEREVLAALKETWHHPLVDEYEALVLHMEKLG